MHALLVYNLAVIAVVWWWCTFNNTRHLSLHLVLSVSSDKRLNGDITHPLCAQIQWIVTDEGCLAGPRRSSEYRQLTASMSLQQVVQYRITLPLTQHNIQQWCRAKFGAPQRFGAPWNYRDTVGRWGWWKDNWINRYYGRNGNSLGTQECAISYRNLVIPQNINQGCEN